MKFIVNDRLPVDPAGQQRHHTGSGEAVSGSGNLWQTTAIPPLSLPSLSGMHETDTVIVGGGLTGLSTALSLADRGESVIVVEAEEPGFGATGQSGGQVTPGLRHFTKDLISEYGEAGGHRAHQFGAEAADRTFELIAKYGIDCAPHNTGKIRAAASPASLDDMRKKYEAWRQLGAPVTFLNAAELANALGTDVYCGGFKDARGGTVQPLSLARGLAQAAQARGATLFSHSRVLSLRQHQNGWQIVTANGEVLARKLLIASNATGDQLWPGLRATILPVWSFQIATAPLTASQRSRILPGGEAVSDTRRVLRYFRMDPDGRLIIGGKGLTRAPRKTRDFNFQKVTLAHLYPELADAQLEYAWGGQVAITIDRLPRIISIGPNAYAHFGCNGSGIAWCTAIGAAFAELFAHGDSRALPIPVTPIQPIPFHGLHRLYVGVGSTWLRFRDMLDGPAPSATKQQANK